jgi:hypothetical protein
MKCFECEIESDCLHNHHVVPRSLGGTKTVLLCEKCHGVVHQRQFSTCVLTSIALQKRKAEGKRVSGWPPYGFRFEGDWTVPDEQEQKIIKLIKKLKAQKRGAGNIANILNKQKIPSRGKKWWAASVKNVFKILCSGNSAGLECQASTLKVGGSSPSRSAI